MKLQELKLSYQTQNTQFITISGDGVVIESDDILFYVSLKLNIHHLHPFFESILETLPKLEDLIFSCVHIEIEKKDIICDIEIKKIATNLYLIIIIDFSKHYNAFKSLVQSRNETTIHSESLIINNELLREKEDFKNKFIANFSHEVRNPITSIISFINLIKDTKLNREQLEYLDIIYSSSFHLNSIINDILDISKIETGKMAIKLAFFDFHMLIEQIEINYNVKCNDKNLNFKVIIDHNIPKYIESDSTRVQQLIQNLLDNAIKFTSQGTISLEIKNIYKRAQNLTLSIIVKDMGTGIEQKYYNTIFRRFNRLENANSKQGVGLGLSIVKEIVELMHGELHFESEINIGTTVTINLKTKSLLTLQKQVNNKAELKAVKDSFKNKPKRKHNILLVEDNTTHQLGIFKILAKTKLFYLDIVTNGIDAIKFVNKTNYDIVLMDFKLPSLNGLETSKAIRNLSDKHKRNIPIIMITGSNSRSIDKNLSKQKEILLFDIIKKPFDEETFITTIHNCLKTKSSIPRPN